MLDPEFVKILVCPDNRTPVRVASEQEIINLNQKIEEGFCKISVGVKSTIRLMED